MDRVTRRGFLERHGAIAAGAFLPLASRGLAAPSDRIRVAVIGCGGRGKDHANTLLDVPAVELASLCDPDDTRLNKMGADVEAKTGRKPVLQPDLRRIFEDRNIDAVTIATCNHWHALAAIWACQAGKHVYVEKPVSHNIFEGRQIVNASRKYQRIVQGGTQRRSNAFIREAVRQLRDGIIGDVYMARCVHYQLRDSLGFQQPEPPPGWLHWDLWLGPAPEQPYHKNLVHYNWHWFWDFGNGELGNNGIHAIDLARWGLAKGLPSKIHSTGGRYGYKDQGQTPNTQLVTCEYDDGTQLVSEVRGRFSNEEAAMSAGLMFYGSKGYITITFDDDRPRLFLGASKKPEMIKPAGDAPEPRDLTLLHFRNFFDAIRANRQDMLNADILETHLSTAICHLGNISYRLGRKLAFDPDAERFRDDSEAAAMLTRTYRKPYVVPSIVS
jgi:predicted dehydrogenase